MNEFEKDFNNKYSIDKMLLEGKTVSFHPKGTSMWPLFVSEEDVAVVEPINNKLRRGDVVVYRRKQGPLVIHRIHHIAGDGVYYVGDHQVSLEGPNDPRDAVGVMVAFVRSGKHYQVDNISYRLLSRLWLFVRPFRGMLIRMGHECKVLIHKLI